MAPKVAIIGGGWTGCHLASRLMTQADVTLFERNEGLISEASLVNQNRLHYGYHYARNHETRMLCQNTFQQFINDYGTVVKDVSNNFYAVSSDESLLDAETVRLIFNGWPHKEEDFGFLQHSSLLMNTVEKYICPIAAGEHFDKLLSPIVRREHISENTVTLLKEDYDLVLDCTNNTLLPPLDNAYFEAVAMSIYRPLKPLPFGALTYIDGPLFSIYPYGSSLFSLSHVKLGVIETSDSSLLFRGLKDEDLHPRQELVEEHVARYWPAFLESFDYAFSVVSMKAKTKNASANRAPVTRREDNLFSFYTGKIQGIYAIEKIVIEALNQA